MANSFGNVKHFHSLSALRSGLAIGVASASAAMLLALFPATGHAAPEGDATIQIGGPFSVLPDQRGGGVAVCPPGSRVVGGGVTQSSGTSGGFGVVTSGPFDETGLPSFLNDGDVGRIWYASVSKSPAGSGSSTFVPTAICSQASDATIRVAPFTVPPVQTGGRILFCPPGSRVVGGGVTQSSGDTDSSAVRISGPLDETGLPSNLANGDVARSWYATVFNYGAGPSTYVTTAICSQASDATIRVAPFTLQENRQPENRQAFCPSGTRVVGGGVTQTQSTGSSEASQVVASGPLDETGLTSNLNSGDVGRSWYASISGNAGSTFASTAICAPPTSTTSTTSNEVLASAVQTCKGKKATIAARPAVLGRTFKGTSNADVIVGTSGKDTINAGAGNDLVCAGAGKDTVKGGGGKDGLFGEGGKDKLLGQGGRDLLAGGAKSDTCVGGPGNDAERSC